MKLLVTGSRTITEYVYVEICLDKVCVEFFTPDEIIVGDASGVDRLTRRWAKARGIKLSVHPANWKKFGKGAGFIRNAQMVKKCDKGVGIWDGQSRGTKHTIDLLYKAGKLLKVFESYL